MTYLEAKKRSILCSYGIAAVVFLLCLAVWPLGLLGHTTYKNITPDRGLSADLQLSDGSLAIGEFTPAHSHLESLSFQFLTRGQALDGMITLEIFDSQGSSIHSITLKSGDAMNYRWTSFPLKLTLSTEETYTYALSASGYSADSLFLYTGADTISPSESGSFYYNGTSSGSVFPAITYQYQGKADQSHCLPYYAVFFLSGLLFLAACRKFTPHEEITDEKTTFL